MFRGKDRKCLIEYGGKLREALSDSGPAAGCALLTETQQFDVLNALRQLTEACERTAKHGEAITVRVKRQNARKLLDQLEHNDLHQSERGTKR